jgi:hypothetical protein
MSSRRRAVREGAWRAVAAALATLGACLLLGLLGGCGDESATTATREATLVLDFVPGPVHAGISEAHA